MESSLPAHTDHQPYVYCKTVEVGPGCYDKSRDRPTVIRSSKLILQVPVSIPVGVVEQWCPSAYPPGVIIFDYTTVFRHPSERGGDSQRTYGGQVTVENVKLEVYTRVRSRRDEYNPRGVCSHACCTVTLTVDSKPRDKTHPSLTSSTRSKNQSWGLSKVSMKIYPRSCYQVPDRAQKLGVGGGSP